MSFIEYASVHQFNLKSFYAASSAYHGRRFIVIKKTCVITSKYNNLIEALSLLRQQKFAASSEKSPGQGEFFDEAESTQENADASLEDGQEDIII